MNNKILVYMFIVILSITSVLAMEVYRGEPISLYQLNSCYGGVKILVKQEDWNVTDNYFFVGCRRISVSNWECDCDKNNMFDVIINTKANNSNKYNFVVQYYNAPILNVTNATNNSLTREEIYNNMYKVVLNLNDIVLIDNITLTPEQLAEQQRINELMPKIVIGIIVFVFIVIIVLGIYMFKRWNKEEKYD